jgi:hypothetical protein
MTVFYPKAVDFDGIRTPSPDPWRSDCRTAGIGQNRSFAGASPNVRLQVKKRTFEPIAAVQNDLFVGYVSFGISKRKKLAGSDFVAS